MRQLLVAAVVLGFVGMAGWANGQEKSDPTGTWKWSFKMGEQTREVTLKLKLEGGKLTGAMAGREGQADRAIEDASFKAGEVSFKVTRERDGRKMTSKYTGKVSGDTIKGKMEFAREGQNQSRDWEAKRAK